MGDVLRPALSREAGLDWRRVDALMRDGLGRVYPAAALLVALLTNRAYRGRDPAAISAFRPRLHNAVIEALEG